MRDGQTWLAYGIIGFFAFLQAVLGPLMPFLQKTLGINYGVASLHFSAFALGATLAGVFGEPVIRRWGRARVVWGGAVGMLIGMLAVVLAASVAITIPGALVMGLFGVLLLNAAQASLTEHHQTLGPVALTEANVYASSCAILAAAAVGVLTTHGLSWRAVFLPALAMLVALAAITLARGLRARPSSVTPSALTRAEERSTVVRMRPSLPRRYWAFWGVVILETGAEWIFAYWGASFLVARGTFSAATAATAVSIYFVAMLAGRALGSRLVRVVPGRVLLAAALGTALIGFPIFWLAPLPALQVAGLCCIGLGLANVYPVGVGLAAREAPAHPDSAMARLAIGTGLAVLVAPAVLGALADVMGIIGAFVVALPLLLAALVVALLVAMVVAPEAG